MQRLRDIYNWSALGIYGLNEVMQKLHLVSMEMRRQNYPDRWPSPYDLMPFGGETMRFYASSFSGAVAIAFVSHALLDRFAPKRIAAYKLPITLTGVAGLLMTREALDAQGGFAWRDLFNNISDPLSNFTNLHLANLDTGDLTCYVIALGIFTFLNKARPQPEISADNTQKEREILLPK